MLLNCCHRVLGASCASFNSLKTHQHDLTHLGHALVAKAHHIRSINLNNCCILPRKNAAKQFEKFWAKQKPQVHGMSFRISSQVLCHLFVFHL